MRQLILAFLSADYLGAMKIVLGWRRFMIYILFTMVFAWGTGMIVDLLI